MFFQSGVAPDHERKQSELYHYGNSKKTYRLWNLSSFKDLLQAIVHLLSNPTLMLLNIAGCLQAIVIFGTGDIIARYFENAFNMNSEDSGLISGKSPSC